MRTGVAALVATLLTAASAAPAQQPPAGPPPVDEALAALSTRGVNARVPGANHMIQLVKPQAVLDAVAEVVREARASGR